MITDCKVSRNGNAIHKKCPHSPELRFPSPGEGNSTHNAGEESLNRKPVTENILVP